MLKQLTLQEGDGRLRVFALVTVVPDGLVVQIYGGEEPHVGAVAMSIPRESLKDPGKTSCNTTVVPVLGHKDDEAAKPVAEKLARTLGQKVVVISGIHVNDATEKEIEALIGNCLKISREIIKKLCTCPDSPYS